MTRSAAQLVPVADLFEYPIGADDRLDGHFFLTWRFHDWLTSDFRLLSDLDVRAVGFDLFNIAHTQSPVGTLPVEDRLLSRLVGVSLELWQSLCARPIGPLYNWQPCKCPGGALRLYHPKVLQTVQDALGLRGDKLAKREADRARKRLEALPEQVIRAGASDRYSKDEDQLIRLDEFLFEHFPHKQRRPAFMRLAMAAFELDAEGRDWRAETGL